VLGNRGSGDTVMKGIRDQDVNTVMINCNRESLKIPKS
jgi:hypothetical protein